MVKIQSDVRVDKGLGILAVDAGDFAFEYLAKCRRNGHCSISSVIYTVALAPAIQKGLAMTGLKLDDMKLIEINKNNYDTY